MVSDQSKLVKMVALAFNRAMSERQFAVAELMLQALELLNAEHRYEAVVTDALLAVAKSVRT